MDLRGYQLVYILGRANLKTMILYQEETSLDKADKIENYYGLEEPITGKQLYERGRNQAKKVGIELKKEEVVNILTEKETFQVVTPQEKYQTKTVILATGNRKNTPQIKGLENLEGRGVSYCAICDGFFYKNKEVAVIGNGNYAIQEANELLPLAKKITILTNGEEKPKAENTKFEINTKKIVEVIGDSKIESILFQDGTSLKIDGLFIAQGVAGGFELAKKLGILTKKEQIIVNEKMETNVEGVYACGDCTRSVCYKLVKQYMKEQKQDYKQLIT